MSLREAVAAVRKIDAAYRKSPADREHAAKLIGYSTLSGPASKALAALAIYGLVERAGKGELRVSDRASRILHTDSPQERQRELELASVEPTIYQDMAERWPGIVPPEDGVATFLRRHEFAESAIKPAVRAYLDTIAFLAENRVSESHRPSAGEHQKSGSSGGGSTSPARGGARVGDLVQWESQGALRFEQPRRVRHVSEDGMWVAVEGSETGLPMAEIIVEQRAPAGEPPKFSFENVRADHSVEWIRNDVGPDTKAIIYVTGEMGPKEIGKLIRLLEAQKAVLEDD
ncbi:MAG: hypothetical protein ABS54_10050 [Hyphomicrobium sp. SCN 65-11]|nr:MAG: hypothetical protein ABS54_10050 [Hyphomicrobium sp. SCN 65-11]